MSSPGRSRMKLRTMSCVPSVEPVSEIAHASTNGFAERRQRSITGASFLTMMLRQMRIARLCLSASLHRHAGLGAVVDVEQKQTAIGAGGENHALRYTEAHLARREI